MYGPLTLYENAWHESSPEIKAKPVHFPVVVACSKSFQVADEPNKKLKVQIK